MIEIHNKGGIEIMKASAGSGKTFSLTREYIRLLLSHRDDQYPAHGKILAVTFTNKATAEMKARIISELNVLSENPSNSGYRDYLMECCSFGSEQQLQKASRKALDAILDDYSSFSVSTIDSFFQQTLRAFSREIGQFADYKIELEKDPLVSESVDRVLDALSNGNGDLLEWLKNKTIESIKLGKRQSLESDIQLFAKGYLSPSYIAHLKECGVDLEEVFSDENIRKLDEICREEQRNYNEGIVAAATELKDLIDSYSFSSEASSTIVRQIDDIISRKKKLTDINKYLSSATWKKAYEDPSTVFKVKAARQLGESDKSALGEKLAALRQYSGTRYKFRRSVDLIWSQVYVLKLAGALRSEFNQLLKEKNVLSIDDTNNILSEIIAGSDVPFIYEKTGNRYKHFLLDEFQDTNRIQWDNFKPLISNSVAEGCYNLVVGDVKQSIYRWRDADWHILSENIGEEFKGSIFDNPLKENYRSAPEIVNFNNDFYKFISEKMSEIEGFAEIKTLYSDVSQICKKEDLKGEVRISACSVEELVNRTVTAVREALGKGFRYKDIGILVRTNSEGSQMATGLIQAGIPVITNDSLNISSSIAVRKVVSALNKIDNPSDLTGCFLAQGMDIEKAAASRCLVEMAECLFSQLDGERLKEETLYILAFIDLLRDYSANNGDSLHGFLQYWKESCMGKSIASPSDSDAVTVITIHKCKGLAYPCVIHPIRKDNSLYRSNGVKRWEMPQTEGTPLEQCSNALYNVNLSGESENTLFEENYRRELKLSYIDELNTLYVATTRARSFLHLICPLSKKQKSLIPDVPDAGKDLGSLAKCLSLYLANCDKFTKLESDEAEGEQDEVFEEYSYGELSEYLPKIEPSMKKIPLEFTGRNPDAELRARIRISNDASDFFHFEEGEHSPRKKGTVYHSILQNTLSAEGLQAGVDSAVKSGLLDEAERESTIKMLQAALQSVAERHWFEPSGKGRRVIDERDIITAGRSSNKRPDRVVVTADGVEIIDYKFGNPEPSHRRQVESYMSLYRAMGYKNVKGFIWYVSQGEIQEVNADAVLF